MHKEEQQRKDSEEEDCTLINMDFNFALFKIDKNEAGNSLTVFDLTDTHNEFW